uniref:DUF3700 domain-containing protein n=1 Tax=Chlamydomonas leiostraca TaxID=1034604 RepID=A0A7S0WRI6_9CHLO|mmetsp:Transcript_25190/g.63942  ORF Transcript_25190/g.63942 Transcript_25190/m.63942 type:complete len:298 (+) Transcript_25190:110-1003(+)
MASAHLLAIFGAETARPPKGLETDEAVQHHHTASLDPKEQDLQEASAKDILTKAYEASKPTTRHLKHPGKGCGFSYESSPFCSYAAREGVHVMMAGEVAKWPGVDSVAVSHNAFLRNEAPPEENDAHWLLDFYRTFTTAEGPADLSDGEEVMSKALECLAAIQGSFAFVIYDSVRHRVLAARDRDGTIPLYWGATEIGQLMFGTAIGDLAACNPTAVAFPAGCLFTSEQALAAYNPGERGWVIAGDEVPGDLLSFVAAEDAAHFRGVKAIPRITSKGQVCGAVYKVSSTADMSKPMN